MNKSSNGGAEANALGKGTDMADQAEWPRECVTVRPSELDRIKQGIPAYQGVNKTTTPSRGVSMLATMVPPGGQTKAHYHDHGFETALYIVHGELQMFYGDQLEHDTLLSAGDFLYIPPFCPHKGYNRSNQHESLSITARNDPFEQERVVLLPDLEDGRCDARVSFVD
jgi:uncharacterized RmlC-like cupin family protein